MSSPRFHVAELEGIELLQCSVLFEEGFPHGFTLRTGGFGARGNRESDRARLAHAVGLDRIASMHQVHGNDVRVFDEDGAPRCDGLITDRRGSGVVVQSADCVPLLLSASKRKAVAAIHAGWRGTLARIASRSVSKVSEVYDVQAGDIQVAIGPAIRVCCYEVGNEVITAFAERGRVIDAISRPGPRGRRHLDLVEENRAQLLASGIPPENIYDCGLCTYCEEDRFYSFRREGKGVGSIFGVIGIVLDEALHPLERGGTRW